MKVSRVYVLVHPHYTPLYKPEDEKTFPPAQARKTPLPEKLRKALEGNEIAMQIALSSEAFNAFYESEIRRALRKKGSEVVVIKSNYHDIENSAIFDLNREFGIPTHIARILFAHGRNQQRKLLNRLQALSRTRVVVTEIGEKDSGKWLKENLLARKVGRLSTLPVHVFGEYRHDCVRTAHESMVNAGFKYAKVMSPKAFNPVGWERHMQQYRMPKDSSKATSGQKA